MRLSVNGEYALTFDSGVAEDREWKEGVYELYFSFKDYASGNNGVFFLTVPGDGITAGEACTIEASHVSGGHPSWFMIFNYNDLLEYEHIAK